MDAAMNRAEASNSCLPFTLLKRPLDRIHISRGMLKIRISVMELGRFTARGGSGGQPESNLIMRHGNRERNGRKMRRTTHRDVVCYISTRRSQGTGKTLPTTSLQNRYFGAGAILPALPCLATIMSLILSYVACGMIFFCTSSSLVRYGRPSIIFWE